MTSSGGITGQRACENDLMPTAENSQTSSDWIVIITWSFLIFTDISLTEANVPF